MIAHDDKSTLIHVFEYANTNKYTDRLYVVYSRGNKLFVFTKDDDYFTQVVIQPPDYITSDIHRGYTILKGGTPHWTLEWVYTEYGITVGSLTEDEKRILNDAEVMLSL